jgi:hypothetical protein
MGDCIDVRIYSYVEKEQVPVSRWVKGLRTVVEEEQPRYFAGIRIGGYSMQGSDNNKERLIEHLVRQMKMGGSKDAQYNLEWVRSPYSQKIDSGEIQEGLHTKLNGSLYLGESRFMEAAETITPTSYPLQLEPMLEGV